MIFQWKKKEEKEKNVGTILRFPPVVLRLYRSLFKLEKLIREWKLLGNKRFDSDRSWTKIYLDLVWYFSHFVLAF